MCDKAVFEALREGMQTLYTTAVTGPALGSGGVVQGTFDEPPVVFWKDADCATFSGEHAMKNAKVVTPDVGVGGVDLTDLDPWRVMYVPVGLDYQLEDGQPFRAGPHLHRAPALGRRGVRLRRTGGRVWDSVQADVCMGRTVLELAGTEVQLSANCDQVMGGIYRQYIESPASVTARIEHVEDDVSCYTGAHAFKTNPPQDRLPVVCFDANCAAKGYKSAEHLKDACSPPVCVKHIERIADDVSTNHPTIFCDGIHYTFPPKVPDDHVEPTPTAPPLEVDDPPKPDALSGLPAWEWALVWVGILAAFVALALMVAYVGAANK